MRTILIGLFIVLMPIIVTAQVPLQNIFYAIDIPQNNLEILFESDRVDDVLSYNDTGIQSFESGSYYNNDSWFRASMPQPIHNYLGFRGQAGDHRLNPIFWDNLGQNEINKYSLMTTDPVGDQNFTNVNLDLTAVYVTFTDERIYFALKNSGGGFPTSSGFTNFSYMAIMVNPNADPDSNPPVFGLMYTVNITGIIGPGLYKITGTGFSDLQSIGSIESTVDAANNLLFISCSRSDLEADPDFMSWFNPTYPLVGSMAITSRITLTGGTQEADSSPAVNILFAPRQINLGNQSAPVLSDPIVEYSPEHSSASFSIVYSDADHNFPLASKVFLDGIYHSELVPAGDIDYSSGQMFLGAIVELPPLGSWAQIELQFSDDNINTTSHYFHAPVSNADDALALPKIKLYPNPAQNTVRISLPTHDKSTPISIFNLRGQRLIQQQPGLPNYKGEYSLDVSDLPPGLYFMEYKGLRKRFIKAE